MVRRAFPAEVTNGQLRFQESLVDLEGRRVMVVLDECESPPNARTKLTPDALTAEELPAEQDVNFQRPFRRKTIAATVTDGGRLPPCIILPEECSDRDDSTAIMDRDVMLDAWCELPMPLTVGRVTSHFVESLPFDIPHIPPHDAD